MINYYCNDCEDEHPGAGTCKLSLPAIVENPKFCPMDKCIVCNWTKIQEEKQNFFRSGNNSIWKGIFYHLNKRTIRKVSK